MTAQYCEGLPFLKMDAAGERVWIERDGSGALNRFYESMSEGGAVSPIGRDYASGIYEFEALLAGKRLPRIKGHVTGPMTFTLGIKDADGKYLYYDEEMREVALMLLAAKIRWQVKRLKSLADRVLIFIDEPIMSAIGGSAYLGVSRDETLRLLAEIVSAVKEAGAESGIHCCGKADWELVFDTGADVINFDAYKYFHTIEIFHEKINEHLARGGFLAFGIVPTTEEIRRESADSLERIFMMLMERISGKVDMRLLTNRLMLTPSCGTGSLSEDEAEKVFGILKSLKGRLTERLRCLFP
jgi:methionine synthase II (cobalamin-independent)